MDSARKWTKQEKEEVDILSEWVKAVMSLFQIRIEKIQVSEHKYDICIHRSWNCWSTIHDQYVVVPATKASNNIVLIC